MSNNIDHDIDIACKLIESLPNIIKYLDDDVKEYLNSDRPDDHIGKDVMNLIKIMNYLRSEQ